MAAPDPYAGTIEEFFNYNWNEAVQSFRSSGPNMFSQSRGDASLVGYVNGKITRGCLRFCIGYNAVEFIPAAPPLPPYILVLHRTNPVSHPRYPNVFCTSASEEEFSPDGSGFTLQIVGNKLPNPLIIPDNVLGSVTPQGLWAKYKKSKITLRFEQLPWLIQQDAITSGEYQRNCWIDQEPHTDIISLSGFQLTYAEGNAITGIQSAPAGNQYPGEIGQIVFKSDIRLTWVQVPETWLMAGAVGSVTTTFIPTRILYRLGTLNNAPFFNYPKGTLRLDGVKLTREPWTLFENPAQPTQACESRWQYKVEFAMKYFNPQKGYTTLTPPAGPQIPLAANIPGTNTPILGHNNSIWRGGLMGGAPPTLLSDANAGRWFLASYDGKVPIPAGVSGATSTPFNEGANCQFQYTDFTKLFDAADNSIDGSGL